MPTYEPLYINGKRDKARRYVNPSTGEIISRRQYIKITEGVSPESKAYARYLAGKAPKGVTARKYEQRIPTYEPLYVDGKRDKARRFINPSTGEIISRRQHIKITEGASPESKAYARYLAGKTPKGITARKYEKRLKRKEEKERKQKRKEERKSEVIKEKWGWKEVPKEPRGYYQLQGRYRFRNTRTGGFASATGYSTATSTKRYGAELQILRSQAINHAMGRLGDVQSGTFSSGEWVLEGIEYEVWLKW